MYIYQGAHQRPERSHDTYQPHYDILYTCREHKKKRTAHTHTHARTHAHTRTHTLTTH